MTRFVVPFIAMLALSGCLIGQRTSGPDADTDGLPDDTETGGWNVTVVRTVFGCFSTSPPEPVTEDRFVRSNELREDTDADGVTDFDEYFHGGDPTVADTDGDGLTDGEEWDARVNGGLAAPGRLALNELDSDEDCLSDKVEIQGFEIPGLGLRTSDPTLADSDGDGFSDAWEFRRSHSDPKNRDTDGDGAVDRLDLDPLADVWMRFNFPSLIVKEMGADPGRVQLHWGIPTNQSDYFGTSGPIDVRRGQIVTLEAGQSPGLVDIDDQRGGTLLTFEFYGRILDSEGRPVAVLDLNPHRPGDPVEVRYDVADGSWAFRTADGYTSAGQQRSLETSQARLTFDFAHFGLHGS